MLQACHVATSCTTRCLPHRCAALETCPRGCGGLVRSMQQWSPRTPSVPEVPTRIFCRHQGRELRSGRTREGHWRASNMGRQHTDRRSLGLAPTLSRLVGEVGIRVRDVVYSRTRGALLAHFRASRSVLSPQPSYREVGVCLFSASHRHRTGSVCSSCRRSRPFLTYILERPIRYPRPLARNGS